MIDNYANPKKGRKCVAETGSSFSPAPWSLALPLPGTAFCCSWPSPLNQLQRAVHQRVGEVLLG